MATRLFNVLARGAGRKYNSISLSSLRQRRFSSKGPSGEKPSDIGDIPLSKPVPWVPAPQYATVSNQTYDAEVTTLENGLKVATENKFGEFCTVGVLIDSGSRYEVCYPSGITHFLEKLAFASTTKFKDRDEILQKLEEHGGICDCQGSRDTLIYATSAESRALEQVTELLSEVVLRPQITDDEVLASRQAIAFELESLNMRPDPEPLLVELVHAAAFSNNTLGLPKICPEETVSTIDRGMLYTYLSNYHTPDRIVLAGVGIDHKVLVDYATKYFVKKPPIWTEHANLIDPKKGRDESIAQYTGGSVLVEKDLSNVSLGPTPMPELAHCVIGLESCSHKDPDFIAFCVLNNLLGGGGSFSAGGPGKGMYTRLYLNVLNRYPWMYSATAYNHAYNDSGVFCIHASTSPSSLKHLTEIIVQELVQTQYAIRDEELLRAKKQLQSMLLMNLESRPVVFEDIGRQVLATGERLSAKYYYDQIDKITGEDVQRVAKRMLSSKPSVAALGDLRALPNYEQIQKALGSRDGKIPHRFSLFG